MSERRAEMEEHLDGLDLDGVSELVEYTIEHLPEMMTEQWAKTIPPTLKLEACDRCWLDGDVLRVNTRLSLVGSDLAAWSYRVAGEVTLEDLRPYLDSPYTPKSLKDEIRRVLDDKEES